MKKIKWIIAFFVLMASSRLFSANLIIQDGKLHGATSVAISDTIYDVTFIESSVYYGIFQPGGSQLDASTEEEARAFSAALIDQVFIGIYDTNPGSLHGCDSWRIDCTVLTPFNMYYSGSLGYVSDFIGATNDYRESHDRILDIRTFSQYLDFSASGPYVLANWEIQIANVPLPAAACLFGSGLLGLVGMAIRQKAAN